MNKLLFFLFLLTSYSVTSQVPNIDSILQKIPLEKNDSARFYLVFSALTESETNPVDDMGIAEKILVLGQKTNDKVCILHGLACLSYDYKAFGNTPKSLEYALKANVVAESSKDNRLIVPVKYLLAANYLNLKEYDKALKYGREAVEKSALVEVNIFTIMGNMFMGEIYLATDKLDSALVFTQKAYELSMSSKITYYLCGIYGQLGSIQSRLNNPKLALNYMNMALEEGYKIKSSKYINIAYNAISEYYLKANQKDSAILYAKKAIASVQKTAFATMVINPSKLLTDIYRTSNTDSAFKYSEMNKTANDSLFNMKALQQTQLMTFEEDARQQELAVVNAEQEEQRKQNIQYALIAFVIVTSIILFLMLSRTYIVNTKLISFFCVIALLIVFEFLNLLLHPFLERITHHSPVLMLLALVCIAALLVPLHHKLEKWTTSKLIEKNKAIRLSKAKKIIEELEQKQNPE